MSRGHKMSIGRKIKELRKSKNISQKKLAELSGLSQAFISTIENDHKHISLNSLEKICNSLQVNFSIFFYEKECNYFNNQKYLNSIIREVKKLNRAERKKLQEFLFEINRR